MSKQAKRIESIRVIREVDIDPDLSWLGEYSNEPGANAIDRQERGDMGRNEFRFCNITLSGEQTGNPASVEHDYRRLEDYNRGGWCMMGVYAVAEVIIGGTIQRIRSGGLYGVESDAGNDYWAELGREQLAELADILKELGFSPRSIKAASPADGELIDR